MKAILTTLTLAQQEAENKAVITNGLNYARARGWNTRYKSLSGSFITWKNYISVGQDTLYFRV